MAVTRNTAVLPTVPSWLYELLPFIYIISGLLVFMKLGGGFAIFSCSLLIFAGIHVLLMRRTHRNAVTKRRRVRRSVAVKII